jgi:serine phosphatase RsbU (regulator of sigma subunit)
LNIHLDNFDKYLDHSRSDAYNFYRGEKNLISLRRFFFIGIFIIGIISIIDFSENGKNISPFLYLFLTTIFIFLRIFYKKIFNINNISKNLFAVLILLLITLTTIGIISNIFDKPGSEKKSNKTLVQKSGNNDEKGLDIKIDTHEKSDSTVSTIFFICLIILFFRSSKSEIIQLYTLAFGIPLLTELIIYNDFSVGNKIASLILTLMFFVIAYTTENKRQKKFFRQYDFYARRDNESRRMKKELDYAREIQLSMLPESKAKIGEIEIAATSSPTYEVGGDYFDYFKISDTLTGVFVCDVSGHGVASALLLSGLRSCMHLILEDTSNPKEVFIKLNKMIRKTQNRKMFVTAVFLVIDTEKNICSLFNAGHLPPYRISGSSNELFKIKRHGITLGAVTDISKDMGDTEVTFEFNKNDKLVLYTDGVTEAMDINKNEYGFEKLEKFLNHNIEKSPDELLDNLISDINNFTKNTEQRDDLTALIIRRN